MTSNNINVLILGATGKTGGSIVNGLVELGGFNHFAAVRPASMAKPATLTLKEKGFQLRTLDLDDLSESSMLSALDGIKVVISCVDAMQLHKQTPIIDAAKKAGVERFVPCDFGTAGKRGTRDMLDQKLGIRDHIKQIGLGYTFIDVGWWMQLLLPTVKPSQKTVIELPAEVKRLIQSSYGDGTAKNAITDLGDIGHFVARIVRDPRTLNRYVFCWGQEVTGPEFQAVVREASGEQVEFPHISNEEVLKSLESCKANGDYLMVIFWGYMQSQWVEGENNIAHAAKPEYGSALDARQLYPEFKPRTVQEFAKEYYSQ